MKKILLGFLITLVLFAGTNKFALAEGASVNLTVKNNGDVVYSGNIGLPPAGTVSINDSGGNPHDTNADSVLSIINIADASSGEFNISNLVYYDMFGAFYLKCINVSSTPLCDNWQYKVNGDSPSVGMDSKILSSGEEVVLYFGNENKPPQSRSGTSHGSSLGSGRIILNTVLPAPLPTTPTPSNTNPEEKPKITATTTGALEKNLGKQNLEAAVVNSAAPTPAEPAIEKTEAPKKNWFLRFLDNLFSIF